ncbi:MAG: tRNA (N6-isopentenyl adenosine(37)-C2)-methylthiotransferase MiaB [Acidobacteria bacterium]|nr:tRNA (N6-isopentenyl adenosine(37)-C2)-methylthiotransferase MiaB [Acidobacteriota bacterium]
MAKKYLIETFGCQMNVHDSERLAGLLEQAGYEPTDDERDADVVVINTCSVREHAEEKLYTRLGELRVLEEETGRRPLVAVAGCVAQQEGAALVRKTNGHVIDVVLGTQRLKMLPMLVQQATGTRRRGDRFRLLRDSAWSVIDVAPWDDMGFPLGVARRGDPVKAYVTIIEGCNDYCAFCVVPYTRGHERMRPKADILAEVRQAAETGRREIQLLGQIVNHYQAPDDPRCDFATLLEAVHEVPGVERIRFASPHPRHTGARLIEAVRDLPKVCKHLHLPVQSGSTRVLQAMRRRHSREDYLDLVARIRAAIPNVALSTDMIVGFPGETREDFDETLSLVEAVQYHSIFSFKYSARPNTLASKRMPDDVSEEEKTARIVALQARQREIQTRLYVQAVGRTVEVLVDAVSRRRDGEMSGRTTGNTVVNFPIPACGSDSESRIAAPDSGAWLGRTVPVTIWRAGPNSLWGEVAGVPAVARAEAGVGLA